MLVTSGLLAASLAAALFPIARSPDHRVALVELFTSEGCSSCPPADRALTELGAKFARAVPLAFHVTYWNHLGWTDRFSDPTFDRRQRDYATRPSASDIYTPQILVNGRDLRSWRRDLKSTLAQIETEPAGFDLVIEAEPDDEAGNAVTLHVTAVARGRYRARTTLHVAIFERHLETRVDAGENHGRTLRHDVVVRALARAAGDKAGRAELRQTFAIPAAWKRCKRQRGCS